MADWELLKHRFDGRNIIRRAQCPYCDSVVEYKDDGNAYPPENCPSCAASLDYARPCGSAEGSLDDIPICRHRGSCYGCRVFQEAHWDKYAD